MNRRTLWRARCKVVHNNHEYCVKGINRWFRFDYYEYYDKDDGVKKKCWKKYRRTQYKEKVI